MKHTQPQLWDRFKKHYRDYPSLGLSIDVSRMNFSEDFFPSMEGKVRRAFEAMKNLEAGGIANPDENRMVGHYWLRTPALAPSERIRSEIKNTLNSIKEFAAEIRSQRFCGEHGPFKHLLVIGIGGSALGPQFVSHALKHSGVEQISIHFIDNTDPDGMDRVFSELKTELGVTLCVIISKSGGTKETRNGMLETINEYKKSGLTFAKHAVVVTAQSSELEKIAISSGYLKVFPMWDWVGGRTSELSAVGLVPAALQGFDIEAILSGASACDHVTRSQELSENPAMLLALMWYYVGNGRGKKDMVILPYKDRLELFSKYLQQLIMESLGKELDLDGHMVNQGISVFGNKGSTDQHAYVQQLRDGLNNFFVTFIEVLKDRNGDSISVEDEFTSGDFLHGFYLGTRSALYEKGRESITITINEVSPFSIGVLIALFERAVGFYASLINVNAYHQPGVEAGKKAATRVLQIQKEVLSYLQHVRDKELSIEDIAEAVGEIENVELVFKICERAAENRRIGLRRLIRLPGAGIKYSCG